MNKIKVSKATGIVLDWLVGKANGNECFIINMAYNSLALITPKSCDLGGGNEYWAPSTDWAQGGPIIDREDIIFDRNPERSNNTTEHDFFSQMDRVKPKPGTSCTFWYAPALGPTKLIAAMRCYVRSKLGDEVEVPENIIKST